MFHYAPETKSARWETLGFNSGSTTGTVVTASASTNTYGSWTTIGTSGFSYEQIRAVMGIQSANAASYAIDIGISDGTNTWVIAEAIMATNSSTGAQISAGLILPLHIPDGSIIRARCMCSTGSATIQVTINGCTQGINGSHGYARMVNITTLASSAGVVCTSGSANTKARTQVVASSSVDVAAVVAMFRMGSSTTSYCLDVEAGSAGSEEVIFPNHFLRGQTVNEYQPSPIIARYFPSGTRFSVNMQAISASQTARVTLYGFQ